jgi:hypothetical protein
MTPSQKQDKMYDICFNKYHLYTRNWSNEYRTYWYKQGADTLGEVVRYDYYYDKITIATMVIINTNGKLLFCMDKNIEFEEFEQALDKVMLEYKKALVRQKIQELGKDFKV